MTARLFFLHTAISVSLITNISGCSLFITSEDQVTDISRIGIGSYRKDVEAILGSPKENCEAIKNEIFCHYEYKHDCKDYMSDADKYQIMYADIFTLGLAELFFTPVAFVLCNIESTICYAYDSNNKVIKYGLVEIEKKDVLCGGLQN